MRDLSSVVLVCKSDSPLMKFFSVLPFVSDRFMEDFWTTFRFPFCKARIYYPTKVKDPTKEDEKLDHEMYHIVKQWNKWYGPWMFLFGYTIFPLPVGVWTGRWFLERNAYLINIIKYDRPIAQVVHILHRGYFFPHPQKWMTEWFENQVRLAKSGDS